MSSAANCQGADDEFVSRIIGQLDATVQGAIIARDAVSGRLPRDEARRQMIDVEHQGDEARAQLVSRLSRSLMTPIDREDLFPLSRSVDDVLDNLRDFVRELDLLQVHGGEPFVGILDPVIEGVQAFGAAVGDLGDNPERVSRGTLAAKKNKIRERYQLAVATVLDGEVTMDKLKRRELLRRLDVVGLRLGEAADALADGAMKRSH